jgi:hypothetical protein
MPRFRGRLGLGNALRLFTDFDQKGLVMEAQRETTVPSSRASMRSFAPRVPVCTWVDGIW